MRKLIALMLVFGIAMITGGAELLAQDAAAAECTFWIPDCLKKYFIDGDWRFMSFVLICLILGLAFCIERIITLNIASANTDKLLERIDENLKEGKLMAQWKCANQLKDLLPAFLYEGLKNADQGPDAVEKAIVSYGAVQMGLTWKKACLDFTFYRHCSDAWVSWVR